MGFENIDICHLNTTNKFESLVGVLNIAPTKISGQYKIVVDKNKKLWLDDYCGRRVAIDLSISFLQQVANFLQVNTIITDVNKLRYGGFQESIQKLWHIPMYFGCDINEDFPRYFVLNQVPNENIKHHSFANIDYVDENNQVLYIDTIEASNDNAQSVYEMGFPFRFGKIIKCIDLKEIGLYDIFNEINKEDYFTYPLYFDWDEQKVNIFGYGIYEGYPKSITINLANAASNQPYFENINNKILNSFVENNIFYPRFLNIEFEFDFDDTINVFNNFMGYLAKDIHYEEGEKPIESNSETDLFEQQNIEWNGLNPQHIYIKRNNIDWKQISWQLGNYELNDYLIQTAVGTIGEIIEKRANYRFQTVTLNIDDTIRIYHPENLYQEFEYSITSVDIKNNLYDSWKTLCQKLTKLAKRNYYFSCVKSNNSVIVTIETDFNAEECIIELPVYYKTLNRVNDSDNYNKFRGITENDIWLVGQPNLTTIGDTITINDKHYKIIDKFYITDEQLRTYSIIRLDKPAHIKNITICRMFETHKEYVCRLDPINYLKFYSQIPSTQQSNIKEYSRELFNKFKKCLNKYTGEIEINKVFLNALSKFTGISIDKLIESVNNENDSIFNELITLDNNVNQYILEDSNKNLIDTEKIGINYVNENIIKSMIFCSMGNTAYFTPNILNIDKQFWNKNGNLDIENIESDYLKFSWFLINGPAPKYCIDSWRYMKKIIETDINGNEIIKIRPQITSRLIKITDSLCETIFLGVKYHLPIQYENYQFAVYLNYNNQRNIKNEYQIELYPEENLILLSVNHYIDFNDLIRGGDDSNEAIIDLSIFQNIHNSMNTTSNLYNNFQNTYLIFEPFYNSEKKYMCDGIPRKDWIVNIGDLNNIDYRICIRAKDKYFDQDLREIFTEDYKTFYKYCEIEYNGDKYIYPSLEITFEGITDVFIDYFWCKDIKVRFFDSKNIFLRRLNPTGNLSKDYYIPEFMEEILYVNKNKIRITTELDYESSEFNPLFNYHKISYVVVNDFNFNREQRIKLLLPDKVLSFKEDWFRFDKNIDTDKIDGEKNQTIISSELLNNQDIYKEYYQAIIQELKNNETIYEGSINLFERNQVWKLIQDMIQNLKFKEMTENQVKNYINEFTITELLNIKNKNIPIVNRNDEYLQYVDKYIPIDIIPINKNYVIWKPKIYYINRYQAPYIPYLPIETDYFKFQIKEFQKNDTIWNLYDDKFGGQMTDGTNISATTLYQEVVGNIISTLFCKSDDIVLTTNYKREINYRSMLLQITNFEKCIINNDNGDYITSLNKNQKEYIIETFVDYLLQKFYKISEVKNELGTRLKYSIDKKNKYNLQFPDKIELGSRYYSFDNIIIILRRI